MDRCRCYRHFGAKSRSPRRGGYGKERVIVPGGRGVGTGAGLSGFDALASDFSVGVSQILALAKYSQSGEIPHAGGDDTRIRNPRVVLYPFRLGDAKLKSMQAAPRQNLKWFKYRGCVLGFQSRIKLNRVRIRHPSNKVTNNAGLVIALRIQLLKIRRQKLFTGAF